ncbi:EF-hand domain-containing protein [Fadolivirus algeromassiliense]|jgi:Ca2+-binding EF-hand superfamily protein|uniref:EF-hand domain-containing protein n=1 Tax=Fadolivirus FV1/VV64 TaxID=3070911 RepID=A0A7D3UQV5_9VIRU|nr:EF-hand domain-containing protein [Fadolivirus algeromassiliense]QKF94113.1 EF-hand domain-containing protein [Fadolivirus FV1/VV64]
MSELYKLFKTYDLHNTELIDCYSFQKIISILNLPVSNIDNKDYSFDDLKNYIKKYHTLTSIEYDELYKLLNNCLNQNDVNVIMNELTPSNNKTKHINMKNINDYLDTLSIQ